MIKQQLPRRPTNAAMRSREYLTETEITTLIATARAINIYGHRDATMILVCHRHGFRVTELCDLRWDQIDFAQATMAVRRLKNGTSSTHTLQGDELRMLRRLQREQTPPSPFVFTTKRKGPFAEDSFAKNLDRLGKAAGIPFKVHPHMLRHACGFSLANAGQDTRAIQAWFGHRSIEHTVLYTELSPTRFANFWRV